MSISVCVDLLFVELQMKIVTFEIVWDVPAIANIVFNAHFRNKNQHYFKELRKKDNAERYVLDILKLCGANF